MEGGDLPVAASEGGDGSDGGVGPGNGRDHWDPTANGHGTDATLVGVGSGPSRCVDDEVDLAVGEAIKNVGAGTFGNFADR